MKSSSPPSTHTNQNPKWGRGGGYLLRFVACSPQLSTTGGDMRSQPTYLCLVCFVDSTQSGDVGFTLSPTLPTLHPLAILGGSDDGQMLPAIS